jgi:hypothetical protein
MAALKINLEKKEIIEEYIKSVCGKDIISIDIQASDNMYLKGVFIYLQSDNFRATAKFNFEDGATFSFDGECKLDDANESLCRLYKMKSDVTSISYFLNQLIEVDKYEKETL